MGEWNSIYMYYSNEIPHKHYTLTKTLINKGNKQRGNMKPWEELNISKATYYRQKSQLESQSHVVSHESHDKVSPLKFDGHNGNMVKDITWDEMNSYLEKNPNAFVPNWFSLGLSKRSIFG